MLKRIEFSLNLNDPQEATIYRALLPALRYRRGGAVIRQALGAFLGIEAPPQAAPGSRLSAQEKAADEQE